MAKDQYVIIIDRPIIVNGKIVRCVGPFPYMAAAAEFIELNIPRELQILCTIDYIVSAK